MTHTRKSLHTALQDILQVARQGISKEMKAQDGTIGSALVVDIPGTDSTSEFMMPMLDQMTGCHLVRPCTWTPLVVSLNAASLLM